MDRVERDGAIEEDTLVELLQRAQQSQNAEAFDGIYLLYADRVFRYLLVRLGNVEQAEEIASQVFLHLIERIQKYRIAPADNVAIFSAWLYRMTYNKMIDVIRKNRRSQHMPIDVVENMSDGQIMTERVIDRLESDELLQTLVLLNENQRQVLLLRFIEGYNIAETAQIIQKSEGAVKALQHRALENLRRYVEEQRR